jgi:hypothetical protein
MDIQKKRSRDHKIPEFFGISKKSGKIPKIERGTYKAETSSKKKMCIKTIGQDRLTLYIYNIKKIIVLSNSLTMEIEKLLNPEPQSHALFPKVLNYPWVPTRRHVIDMDRESLNFRGMFIFFSLFKK